jgi:excisionase family DNA binding protein
MMNKPKDFLTLAEIAKSLGVSKSKLYTDRRQGKLRVLRFGRAVRVSREQFAAYVREAVGPGAEWRRQREARGRSTMSCVLANFELNGWRRSREDQSLSPRDAGRFTYVSALMGACREKPLGNAGDFWNTARIASDARSVAGPSSAELTFFADHSPILVHVPNRRRVKRPNALTQL